MHSKQYYEHAKEIAALLPARIQGQLTTEQPFLLNHQISFRLNLPSPNKDYVQYVKTAWDQAVKEKGYSINGVPVYIAMDISPQKRNQFKQFFRTLGGLRQLAPDEEFSPDTRAMAVFTKNMEQVYKISGADAQILWSTGMPDKFGVSATEVAAAAW